jgi:site-specific DNA-methyltransferase (adenine-specific)
MVQLYMGDALTTLKNLPDNSVHLCVTDPPYFIDGLGDEWDRDTVVASQSKAGVVGGLPVGMKFDPQQGIKFQAFMHDISKEVYRVLVPGAFYVSFTQARLYHRLGVAVEDAGFEIRDMLAWKYEGQAKAFSQDHFVRKMKISDAEKERIIADLGGRKTPQLKPQMEPMTLAQKPKSGTFVENWLTHRTGLVDVTQSLDGMFPGNVMEAKKPSKAEKGEGNDHPTVKPVGLISHLIQLFSTPGQVVLDPFLGSGSHGIAAVETGREFIGIERHPHYFDIATNRIGLASNCLVGDANFINDLIVF